MVEPIHTAAGYADVDYLRQFLEEGVSPTVLDQDGLEPIHHVCVTLTADEADADKRITCLNILVNAGADINAETRRASTPLSFAASFGHPKFVAAVLNAGANVNFHNLTGWTPLHWACRRYSPSVECVELLLKAGAAVNPTTFGVAFLDDGRTPLDFAIIKGNQRRIYPTLLRAGATHSQDTTPLRSEAYDDYLHKVHAAGDFRTYERAHLNAIAATFIPKLPLLPPEMVRRVVEYAFHVGDY